MKKTSIDIYSKVNEKPFTSAQIVNAMLPSTKALIAKQRKQMGTYCHNRYLRNLGLSFEEAYFLIFGREPKC